MSEWRDMLTRLDAALDQVELNQGAEALPHLRALEDLIEDAKTLATQDFSPTFDPTDEVTTILELGGPSIVGVVRRQWILPVALRSGGHKLQCGFWSTTLSPNEYETIKDGQEAFDHWVGVAQAYPGGIHEAADKVHGEYLYPRLIMGVFLEPGHRVRVEAKRDDGSHLSFRFKGDASDVKRIGRLMGGDSQLSFHGA